MSNAKLKQGLFKYFKRNFPDFCKHILKIRDEDGNLLPLILNPTQLLIWEEDIKPKIEAWEAGTDTMPLYLAILKDRQEGVSTMIQALCYWLAVHNSFRESIVTAHDVDSASHLFSMQKVFDEFSPAEYRHEFKLNNRNEMEFEGLHSRIKIDTADNANLGRSYTYSFVHLSEFAAYDQIANPKAMMAGLNHAIPKRPWIFVFIETTAQGDGYFKQFWYKPSSKWKKRFISWLVSNKYRKDIEVKDYFQLSELDQSRYGNEVKEAERVRRELIKWHPKEAEDLAWLDHETMCRLAWRRWNIDEESEGDKALFGQEFPTTEEDAFISTGLNVFDQPLLLDLKHWAEKEPEPARYRFMPEMLTGTTWWGKAFKKSTYGELEVFEQPSNEWAYLVTGDPSEGLSNSDDAGCSVWKLPYLIEVATFDGTPDPEKFAYIMFTLSKIYNNGMIIHEVNNHGHACTVILQRLHARMYWREVFDDVRKRRELKFGWKTGPVTKPIMINALRTAIKDGSIQPRSLRTIKQLTEYQRLLKTNKAGIKVESDSQYGPPVDGNAGLVIAAALAVQGAKHPQATKIQPANKRAGFTAEWWGQLADQGFQGEVPYV